jgi:hypothetical protein
MKQKSLPTLLNCVAKYTLLTTSLIFSQKVFAQHNTGTPEYAYYVNSTFDYKVPFANTDTLFQRAQLLYRANDIKSLNGGGAVQSGTIRKVYLRCKPGTAKVFNMTDVIIKLGQTTDTNYDAGTSPDVPFHICTEVFKQAAYTISTPGWIEFELSTPFAYDKSKTLVVEVSGDNGFNCTTGTGLNRRSNYGEFNSSTGAYGFSLQEFGFDFKFPAAVSTLPASAAIQLYPNPAADRVQVSVDESIDGQIVITDINGRVVLQETFKGKEHSFSVASFNSGLYFYKIFSKKNLVGNIGKLTVYH